MELHLLEPDPQAVQALGNGAQSGAKLAHVHALALAAKSGTQQLHVTSHGSMSSLLAPDLEQFVRGFGEVKNAPEWIAGMEVRSKVEVQTKTLGDFVRDERIPYIDLLKLDTQGSELDILKSGEELLRAGRTGVICTEVTFFPLYEGQSWFSEIDIFLRACGFRFIECRSYPDVMERVDEFTPGSKLYERPKQAPMGDAWYAFEGNAQTQITQEQQQRTATVLAAELYFSEATHLLKDSMSEQQRNELFRYLSEPVREPALKHFLRRWTPPALRQWRAKRK